jgi:TPR repeat protein
MAAPMWLRWAALAALMLGILVPPAGATADDQTGWQAYSAGDYERAARIWGPAAERGDVNAAFGMGVLAEARGNETEATHWYETAALGGMAAAQALMGHRYLQGLGVPRDPIVAYAWFVRATKSGVPNAAKARDALARTLTPAQIEEAEGIAARMAPG